MKFTSIFGSRANEWLCWHFGMNFSFIIPKIQVCSWPSEHPINWVGESEYAKTDTRPFRSLITSSKPHSEISSGSFAYPDGFCVRTRITMGFLRDRRVGKKEIQLNFWILKIAFVYKTSNPIIALKDTQASWSMIQRVKWRLLETNLQGSQRQLLPSKIPRRIQHTWLHQLHSAEHIFKPSRQERTWRGPLTRFTFNIFVSLQRANKWLLMDRHQKQQSSAIFSANARLSGASRLPKKQLLLSPILEAASAWISWIDKAGLFLHSPCFIRNLLSIMFLV